MTGYIFDTEIYASPSPDQQAVLSTISSGCQQEPHAVHGFLQLHRAPPPAEEQTGSPGRGHHHAKPEALPQETVLQQEADRMWPVQIPALGRSVCHRLKGPQALPLPEQLPRPEESVYFEHNCGGQLCMVDHATACGWLCK